MTRMPPLHEIRRVGYEEVRNFDLRVAVVTSVARLLPDQVAVRLRTRLLRLAGYEVGAGTTLYGRITVVSTRATRSNLHIGMNCFINTGCVIDVTDRVSIGDEVSIGHQALLLTSTHELAGPERRAGALTSAPIDVGDGVWLGARCIVLPGVTIGHGAVVAAGAVVSADVPPDTMVAGVPARVKRAFEP